MDESSSLLPLEGRHAAGGRGPRLVDRVIDDLLRDDLRVCGDAWQRDEDLDQRSVRIRTIWEPSEV